VPTATGKMSYEQLEAEVFRPFGFRIKHFCTPFPVLEYIHQLNCDNVVKNWLEISNKFDPNSIPMK
jgi:hypothetical protein